MAKCVCPGDKLSVQGLPVHDPGECPERVYVHDCCMPRGVSAQWSVIRAFNGGCLPNGVCLPNGGCLTYMGVSAQWGCLPSGGVYIMGVSAQWTCLPRVIRSRLTISKGDFHAVQVQAHSHFGN